MCLGIACEVVEVEDRDTCLLRVGTGVQRCFTGLVEPLHAGDWVLLHAGFAVRRISEDEAQANLELVCRAARLQEEALRDGPVRPSPAKTRPEEDR